MRTPIIPAVAALLLSAGVAMAQPYAPPPYAPVPPPQVEIVPAPPGPRMLWEPGHWQWNGAAYVWIRGRYIAAARRYHHWVEGFWARRGPRWVWAPAHWE